MAITTVVVDDEAMARQRLINLIREVPDLDLVCECRTGQEAQQRIKEKQPDLVFLDVRLKDINGLQMWESIIKQKLPMLVVVSAHHSHATEAFESYALDYLLKPFQDARFFKTINRAITIFDKKQTALQLESDWKKNTATEATSHTYNNSLSTSNILPIKEMNKLFFVKLSEILYIVSVGHNVEIVTDTRTYTFRKRMNLLQERLDNTQFQRIHRSAIINLNHVKDLVHSNYGELDIRMKDMKLLRISRGHKADFLKKMGLSK